MAYACKKHSHQVIGAVNAQCWSKGCHSECRGNHPLRDSWSLDIPWYLLLYTYHCQCHTDASACTKELRSAGAYITMPPSMLKVCPVMYAAAGSITRNFTSPATSSGWPYLSAKKHENNISPCMHACRPASEPSVNAPYTLLVRSDSHSQQTVHETGMLGPSCLDCAWQMLK